MNRIILDLSDDAPAPKRGDRLQYPKNTYYVLSSRPVKRRDPNAGSRFSLWVAKVDELEDATRGALLRSACRRGGSLLYQCRFYPRKKKGFEGFEALMRGEKR